MWMSPRCRRISSTGRKASACCTCGAGFAYLRSCTVNVPVAIGMAAALKIRAEEMAAEAERLTILRNELWDRIVSEIDGVTVNGPRERRLPGNLNVSFARIDAASLMVAMRHFSLSSGSACS